MAYEPINWQTGDTITAEKMNRMDPGYGMQETELFSETVTTEGEEGLFSALLVYGDLIDSSTIVVTFDGTEYVCNSIDISTPDDSHRVIYYGGFGESGPDFTDFPFVIASYSSVNVIYTETAGIHTVAVSAPVVIASSYFNVAVNSCIDIPSSVAILCVPDVTEIGDVYGKLPFFFEPYSSKLHIIVTPSTTCEIVPESDTITAHFSRDTGLFYITT